MKVFLLLSAVFFSVIAYVRFYDGTSLSFSNTDDEKINVNSEKNNTHMLLDKNHLTKTPSINDFNVNEVRDDELNKIEKSDIESLDLTNETPLQNTEIAIKEYQDGITNRILELDKDVLNKNLKSDLENQLESADAYRENILIKAKNEMKQ